MTPKEKVEREFWKKKIYSVFKEKMVESSLTSPEKRFKDVATEMISELKKEISEEFIEAEAHIRSKEHNFNYLNVSVTLENSILKFETYDRALWFVMEISFKGISLLVSLDDYKNITKQIVYFYNHYNQYCEELKPILFEADKTEKTRILTQKSIKAVTFEIMKNTNYEWNLLEEDFHSILQIKTGRKKIIEITLMHKSFIHQIPDIIKGIEQINHVLEGLPYPINIKNYGNNINWKKGVK